MRGGIYVLNFYSAVFVDQLKRGRKTATIRLGDKSDKYERGQVVWVTVGFRHSPREKIFTAVIDDVEVKRLGDLSRRDIEHDNPEFRRLEDEMQVPRADLQPAGLRGRRGHRDPLLADRRAAAGRTSATGRRRTTTERADRWPSTPSSPPGCSSRRASRSGRRSTTRSAGRSGGAGWRRPRSSAAARRRRRRHRRADGLEEPAALPGRVRGDDDPGRAPAPARGPTRSASWQGSAAGASTSRTASPRSSTSGTWRRRSRG